MTDYELTFIVETLTDELTVHVLESFDSITGTTHTGDDFVVLTASGPSAVESAKTAHTQLLGLGCVVLRLEPDLLTRREIAERLETTPQSIGNYVRGSRQGGTFPRAYTEAAGGLWLWGDVVRWARTVLGVDPAPDVEFPTREDYNAANACFDRSFSQVQDPSQHVFRLEKLVRESWSEAVWMTGLSERRSSHKSQLFIHGSVTDSAKAEYDVALPIHG